MKHEIIYTDDYAIIESDEQITKDNWFVNTVQNELYCHNIEHYDVDKDYLKKIIAHRPLTDAPILEGVPLLPEFGESDNVEKLAYNWFVTADKKDTIFDLGWVNIFTAGYKKSKETYKYTEDDLRRLVNSVTEFLSHHEPDEFNDWFEAKIQILQQPKRPKYFECEMEPKYKHIGAVKGIYGSGFRKQNLMYGLPKTITNSQGQKELVGSYIY